MVEFFFSKVAGYNLTKKELHQRFFPVKFVKLFRAAFNQGNFWEIILHLVGHDSAPSDFTGVLNGIAVFLRLHNDNLPLRSLIKTIIICRLAKQINIPKKLGTFLEKYLWQSSVLINPYGNITETGDRYWHFP